MRKNKLIYGLIALVGGVSIIGSAFAAWQFGEIPASEETNNMNVHLTELVEGAGSIVAPTDTFTLVLDQGGITDTTDTNYNNVGLSIVDSSDTSISSTALDATYTISKEIYDSLVASNSTLTVSIEVTINTSLQAYIGLKDSVILFSFSSSDASQSSLLVESGDNYEITMSLDGSTTDNVNALFSWTSKPTSIDEYNSLKSVVDSLTGEAITITYKAEIQ